MRKDLTELAANPDLISGIYNYCDRWCERCPFTSRCLVYLSEEQDDELYPDSRDITNKVFWSRLNSVFQETRELICSWAEEAGIDLDNPEPVARSRRGQEDAERHPLVIAGKKYADRTREFLAPLFETGAIDFAPGLISEDGDGVFREAIEVIQWYQYQIAVKTIRALWSRQNEVDAKELLKDSDGSAKVALVALDRSIGAWRLVQMSLPERSERVVSVILELERLRLATEREFPVARDFIRPGFDEIQGLEN